MATHPFELPWQISYPMDYYGREHEAKTAYVIARKEATGDHAGFWIILRDIPPTLAVHIVTMHNHELANHS